MNSTRSYLYSVLLLILFCIACEQQKPAIEEKEKQIDKICDNIMEKFANREIDVAFRVMKDNTVISPASIDTLLAQTKHYDSSFFRSYGQIRSYEFLLERKVANSARERYYLLKFDKFYLKFEFILYNNGNNWAIASFSFNEDLKDVFE